MTTWHLTPEAYRSEHWLPGDVRYSTNPIQDVLGANSWSSSGKNRWREALPGSVLQLSSGSYGHFRDTHTYDPDGEPQAMRWIVGVGTRATGINGGTTIRPNSVGGSQSVYLEWSGALGLRDLTIRGDDLSAIQTENPSSARWGDPSRHPGNRDTRFHNVEIDGGFSFEKDTGPKNKWGVQAYQLGKSAWGVPGWSWVGGSIHGIYHEHANYWHNTVGDCEIRRARIYQCGRTALQLAQRRGEGPPGKGTVLLHDCLIEDVGLEDGGGGSAITVKGHDGLIAIVGCTIKQGANGRIHERWRDNVTGCIVTHLPDDAHQVRPRLALANSRFVMGTKNPGKGSARRPCLDLAHLGKLRIRNCEVWAPPEAREAIVLDLDTIDSLLIEGENDVRGDVGLRRNGLDARFRDPGFDGRGWRDCLDWMQAEGINYRAEANPDKDPVAYARETEDVEL